LPSTLRRKLGVLLFPRLFMFFLGTCFYQIWDVRNLCPVSFPFLNLPFVQTFVNGFLCLLRFWSFTVLVAVFGTFVLKRGRSRFALARASHTSMTFFPFFFFSAFLTLSHRIFFPPKFGLECCLPLAFTAPPRRWVRHFSPLFLQKRSLPFCTWQLGAVPAFFKICLSFRFFSYKNFGILFPPFPSYVPLALYVPRR